jgi:hypothetical protein
MLSTQEKNAPTDEILKLAERIQRLASEEFPDWDTMKAIYKAAADIKDVRGDELNAEDFAQEIAMPMSAEAEDRRSYAR